MLFTGCIKLGCYFGRDRRVIYKESLPSAIPGECALHHLRKPERKIVVIARHSTSQNLRLLDGLFWCCFKTASTKFLGPSFCLGSGPVVNASRRDQLFHEVARHRIPHHAQSQKGNFRHLLSPQLSFSRNTCLA